MTKARSRKRQITAAMRGNIVQRVLVDGWSTEQAAATFGIAEHHVGAWVAAYRRHGMASLRDKTGGAFERAPLRWLWLLRLTGARFAARLRAGGGRPDDRPGGSISLGRRGSNSNHRQPDSRDRRSRGS